MATSIETIERPLKMYATPDPGWSGDVMSKEQFYTMIYTEELSKFVNRVWYVRFNKGIRRVVIK